MEPSLVIAVGIWPPATPRQVVEFDVQEALALRVEPGHRQPELVAPRHAGMRSG